MLRRNSHNTGLWAERLCRMALRLRGYRIVASRYRSPRGEVDILACRGKALVCVEVKARAAHDAALAAVSPRQRLRIRHAGEDFLAHHPNYASYVLRFDVMAVARRYPWLLHIRDAWRDE